MKLRIFRKVTDFYLHSKGFEGIKVFSETSELRFRIVKIENYQNQKINKYHGEHLPASYIRSRASFEAYWFLCGELFAFTQP